MNLKKFLIESFYNRKARFSKVQFETLLKTIKGDKFVVLPLCSFMNFHANDKVIIGLRHDIDVNPWQALRMAAIEHKYEIQSTFCFLATAWYSGRITKKGLKRDNLDWIYKAVHELSHEIASHNDSLTLLIKHKIFPRFFYFKESRYFEGLGIKIYGSASHGSPLARELGISNYEIFSDFVKSKIITYKKHIYKIGEASLREFGYHYEAYHLDHNIYISDAGGTFRIDGKIASFEDVICKIATAEKGSRIQLLLHPCWYKLK